MCTLGTAAPMAAPNVIAVVTRQSEQVTVRAPNGTDEGGGASALNSAPHQKVNHTAKMPPASEGSR